MKSARACSVLLALLLAGCASAPGTQNLRVMVFNIHAGKDASGVDNLERVAALINEQNADLVLLQEVDRGTTRSGRVDQLDVLKRLTRLHGVHGKSLDYQGGDYGIATLSRWPIKAHEVVNLPNEPPQPRAGGSIEPRVALVVETGGLRIVNTHFDASREETWRLQEVEHLLRIVRERAPAFVGGDFNAEPVSAVLEKVIDSGLNDAWTECGAGQSLTYPDGAPVKRIDYLFFTDSWTCSSAAVLDSRASDHRPLVVNVARDERRR